ncbi:GNAT family N-acetyltransferase [Nocardioides sp. MAH-18]|uniref:GNAT family N-acetyltransferase n=1 Tax=Nocardioides agri TaxID=2682843 RepID=A0A6L6XT27_9ACTN|nr:MULTISPECIES: GNAT family N-acetyltransferase [unclassified Nocardioides]MBA2955059.1 GNAT family N-acetyltransferase [Nocardioides sp. CGMCC 1.13656]MVQ49913.1 GNAT family N-acetyltransferase [Nocardioides sp. MAH-18]
MSRKIVRLTLDHLDTFDAPCRSCLFWELDPVRRERVADRCAEKDAWVSQVLREWGSCGRVALVDEVPVGFLVYAPAAFVPGAASFPTAPASPDAVLLTTAYVDPAERGGGLGRMLVQGMAKDLIRRGGIDAVEAFGDPRGTGRHHMVPVDFLGSVGFKTHRPHPVSPRLRMDLRTAVTWRDEVEAAIERIVGAVRPVTRPEATRGPTPGSARASR